MNTIRQCLFLPFLLINLNIFSQSYLGKTVKPVNLREESNLQSLSLKTLKANTVLFIFSLDDENGFYKVIDIKTSNIGYVSSKYIKITKEIENSEGDAIVSSGESNKYNPEVEVYNNTDTKMTLILNGTTYIFNPQEKYNVTIDAGNLNFVATAPNVTPSVGIKNLEANHNYTWEFYIVTTKTRR